MPHRHLPVLALVAATAAHASAPEATFVVEGTLEVALGQPMVQVRLSDGARVLKGRSTDLERALGEGDELLDSFQAFLDTGASSVVISRSTAARFGVEEAPGAVYHEVGLHGEVAMGVSRPYGLAVAGAAGAERIEFTTVLRQARMLLNRSEEAPLLKELAAGVDVIGMPVIQRLAVEIVPAPVRAKAPPPGGAGGAGRGAADPLDELEALNALMQPPLVRLHDRAPRLDDGSLVVTLESIDFNQRRHAGNAGPPPELARNPVIPGIVIDHGGQSVTGDWLLDTGAASSMICTAHARRLGLLDEAGQPTRPPDFTLTVTGITGTMQQHPGFILERLRLSAGRNPTIEYRRIHVIVRDVSVQRGDATIVLNGVFGMNLLLGTATGLGDGVPDAVADAPFKRIWLDVRGQRMILERR